MTTTTAAPAARTADIYLPAMLRPYQREAICAAHRDWASGFQRILIVLPTGMGKTVVFTTMIADEIRKGRRVLVMVNRDELVSQTIKTLRRSLLGIGVDPTIGIVKAAKNHTSAQVIVASIQTLGRSGLRRDQIGNVDLIVIDEAHHAAANSYIASVKHLGGYDGSQRGTRVLGLTATPIRTDGLGLADIWERIAYRKTIQDAWALGVLHKPVIKPIHTTSLDPQRLAQIWASEAGQRQGIVAVGTVRKAVQVAAAFNALGITAAVIHGDTPINERQRAYEGIEHGTVRVLVNVNVLTEGFDSPRMEVAMLARKMSKLPLVQTVGRVLRTFDGDQYAPRKTGALVLDLVGAMDAPDALDVEPDLSETVPGKREKMAGRNAAPRIKSKIEYKVHIRRPHFGRKHAVVIRIEGHEETVVTKIFGHPVPELIARGREAVRADQEARAQSIRSEQATLRGE